MSKLPAFQFYPGDWRKDMGVQSLSYHDRGVWWEMLCLMHESERRGVLILNGQAMSDEALSNLLHLDKQNLTSALTNLLTTGVASREPETGAIFCRRMVRDEKLRKVRVEAGSKGGNPLLLNQKPTTPVKQIPTPSSSSSVSSSITKPKDLLLPAVIRLPAVGGKEYAVTQDQVAHWTDLYPAVNVLQELRKMVGWLEASASRRKTTAGMGRFVQNWLGRAQDKGPQQTNGKQTGGFHGKQDHLIAILNEPDDQEGAGGDGSHAGSQPLF